MRSNNPRGLFCCPNRVGELRRPEREGPGCAGVGQGGSVWGPLGVPG